MSRLRYLSVGLEPGTVELLKPMLGGAQLTDLPCDLEKLMEPMSPAPHAIICGPPAIDVSVIEVAQTLSMIYKEVPLYFVAFDRHGYDRKSFVKNGFTDACLLPFDSGVLRRRIEELAAKAGEVQAVRTYRPVKLIDLEADERLGFDTSIYLPANRKYLKYTAAGDPIDPERLARLRGSKHNTVYVSLEQMPMFQKYTAEKLKSLGKNKKLSETERKERLESAVRDVYSGLFQDDGKVATFEQGKAILADCQKIVEGVVAEGQLGDWYRQFLTAVGDTSSTYGHANNVSTYAALFSIGLGIGNPGELAIAGLLHDLGLAEVPAGILAKPERERTVTEQDAYKIHPEHTMKLLMKRKMILPNAVNRAILQHHEHFNGTGYPQGLPGSRLCPEGQLLALADKFDELTSAVEGQPLMSPREAVEHLRKQVLIDPTKMHFDPELLKKVLKLFPAETAAPTEKASA